MSHLNHLNHLKCAYCGSAFTARRSDTRYCKKLCRNQARTDRILESKGKSRKSHRWTQEERDFLKSAVATTHPQDLAWALNAFNRQRGYPTKRSSQAITIELSNMGLSVRERIDNMDAEMLSKRIGIAKTTIRDWINRGWLKAKKRKTTRAELGATHHLWSIKARDVHRLFAKRPDLAVGADFDGLRLLLAEFNSPTIDELVGSIKIAQQDMLDKGRGHRRVSIRLQCVDNNTTYPSIYAAAKAAGIHPSYVNEMFHETIAANKRTFQICGVTFAVVDLKPEMRKRRAA